MEQLLKDYKFRLNTINNMIADDDVAESTLERLKVKRGMIRSFIVDIERAIDDRFHDNGGLNLAIVTKCKAQTHELKTWIPFYKAVVGGKKQFEIRKNDRNFKEGDILILKEWDNTLKEYTGRETKKGIIYMLEGGAMGLHEGYVILGLCGL